MGRCCDRRRYDFRFAIFDFRFDFQGDLLGQDFVRGCPSWIPILHFLAGFLRCRKRRGGDWLRLRVGRRGRRVGFEGGEFFAGVEPEFQGAIERVQMAEIVLGKATREDAIDAILVRWVGGGFEGEQGFSEFLREI